MTATIVALGGRLELAARIGPGTPRFSITYQLLGGGS